MARPPIFVALVLGITLVESACASTVPSRASSEPPAPGTGPPSAPTVAPSRSGATSSDASSRAAETLQGRFNVGAGRSLELECRGAGSPTLLFLVGSNVPRTQMREIEDAFVTTHRVCDYDRDDPEVPRIGTEDGELEALLRAASVPGPYVLVGQSAGGNLAWYYASRHPTTVAAFIAMNPGPFRLDPAVMKQVWTPDEMHAEFPKPGSPADIDSRLLEDADPPRSIPYVVMLSTIVQCESPTDICGRFYPAYEAWARAIASRTANGRLVQVDAPHEIFGTRPDAVVTAVKGLLAVP